MMRIIPTVAYLFAVALPVSGAAVVTNVWTGGSSTGGWSVAANWKDNAVPGTSATVVLSGGADVTVTDEDFGLVASLDRVIVEKGSKITFDIAVDGTLPAAVYGAGGMVKKGAGALTLASPKKTSTVNTSAITAWGDYNLAGGIEVLAGTLVWPQDTTANFYLDGHLTVAENAVFISADKATTIVAGLWGEGVVTNTSSEGRTLHVGMSSKGYESEFSGQIAAENIAVTAVSYFRLTGTNNLCRGVPLAYDPSGYYKDYRRGALGVAKFGTGAGRSSIGTLKFLSGSRYGDRYLELRYNGTFVYLGTGETTDRGIHYDTRRDFPCTLDGGAHGGLVLNGPVLASAGARAGELELTGSNAVPCVIAGPYDTHQTDTSGQEVTVYTSKRGSGVWRFADSAKPRLNKGGYGIFDGTLQFDSIAETNVNCSLGLGTLLRKKYFGVMDEMKKVDYAFQLGEPSSTNVVFEFTGSESSASSTRPAVLGSDAHLRANGAEGAALDFAGVTALAEGKEVKTLVLDGTNLAANVLGNVGDGEGRLSVVKEGSGSWTLNRDLTFSGDLTVREGVLTVENNVVDRYFRFTVQAAYCNYIPCEIYALALYDADGIRRNADLAMPASYADNDTVAGLDASLLPEGGCAFGDPSRTFHTYRGWGWTLDKMFESVFEKRTGLAETGGKNITYSNPSTWISVVMRLPEEAPEIVSVDFVQSLSKSDGLAKTPSAFKLEGSPDGVNWHELVATNNLAYSESDSCWYFSDWANGNGSPLSGTGPRKLSDGQGLGFVRRAASLDSVGKSVLTEVGTVSVAAGAVLRAAGDPVTVSSLEIDAENGAGTIENFILASGATVNVTGALPESGETIPCGFSGLAVPDSESITWLRNGKPSRMATFEFTVDGVKVTKSGVIVIIR